MNTWLIYLLEDNADDIYLVKKLLSEVHTRQRYKICAFEDLNSLKRALTQALPDTLLIDLNVPDSMGLDTLVNVKRIANGIPIIVLTGVSEDLYGEQAIQLGAQDYIPKHELSGTLLNRTIMFSKERHDMQKNLENLVSLDRLTMLHNRGAFDQHLQETFSEAQRHNHTFGILFIDLDNFKPVNDELGHQAGDKLLKLIASKLKLFKRSADFVARYGGDEFVIVAHHIDNLDNLLKLANYKYQLLADTYCLEDKEGALKEVRLDVSIGAVMYPLHANSTQDLLSVADKAMYHAKENKLPLHIPAA
jgi:diguanylate cyclase (GGDEF)-like protein